MPDPVERPRKYESPRRRAQAAATRTQILDAAGRLFVEQGYSATTMAAVAADAGVALKTVYVAFETKSGVLRALWHRRLRGDDEDTAVQDRSWFREVIDEDDPRRQLRLNARNGRAVKERVGGLFAVIRDAASADPEIEALWSRIQTEFYDNQRAIARTLEQKQALRPELDVDRAADILWTLNHPDVWRLLVGERGWTPDACEKWFGDTACAQLIRGGTRRTRGAAAR